MNRWDRAASWLDRAGLHLSTPTQMPKSSSNVRPFTIRLKFHGDLPFFLGTKTRRETVERAIREKTSVKDVIESCGVPHPEVDLILVDGQPVDFNHPLKTNVDVDVYSVGLLPTLFTDKRLQRSHFAKFVADGHLGRLTRNLRLLGFD